MSKEPDQTLTYLDHARERMEQRGISVREVEEILDKSSAGTPGKLPGKATIQGSTAAGRKLSVTRFQDKAVVVSVVSLEGPTT